MTYRNALPRYLVYCACAAALLLSGCAGLQNRVIPPTDARAAVVNNATAQLDAPYKFGGDDRTGFDDSGLVAFCYRQAGYQLPHDREDQLRTGQPIRFADAQPGDILFYRVSESADATPTLHAGIFTGNGRMVHAWRQRDKVVSDTIDSPYWFQRLVAVIKILP